MAGRKPRASGAPKDKRRKRRSRPIPKWMTESKELDDIARRRCLMILSVLSGETPVSEVIERLGLSRGTYYQLEQKALEGMLAALVPGASSEATSGASPQKRIAELEAKVTSLERSKRRTERLLYLTRQLVPPGAVTTGKGRPKKKRRSTKTGKGASKRSTKTTSATTARTDRTSTTTKTSKPTSSTTSTPVSVLIRSADGEGGR